MKDKILSINIGFKNCMFPSRRAQAIENVINDRVSDLHVAWSSKRPTRVSVETIDDLHDKLLLKYDDNEDVEGTITWRPSQDGKHYVFAKFE